jgi:hypothetical protein
MSQSGCRSENALLIGYQSENAGGKDAKEWEPGRKCQGVGAREKMPRRRCLEEDA